MLEVRNVSMSVTAGVLKRLAELNNCKPLDMATVIGPTGLDGQIRSATHNSSGDVREATDLTVARVKGLAKSDRTFRRLILMGHVGKDNEFKADNNLININADNAAGALAKRLGATKLLVLGSTNGILDPKGKTVGSVGVDEVERLIDERVITEGMIPKARMAKSVAQTGTGVHIIPQSEANKDLILRELLNKEGCPERATLLTHFKAA